MTSIKGLLPEPKQRQVDWIKKQDKKRGDALWYVIQATFGQLSIELEVGDISKDEALEVAHEAVNRAMYSIAGWSAFSTTTKKPVRVEAVDISPESQPNNPRGLEPLIVERAEVKPLAPGLTVLYDFVIAIERAGFGELTQLSVSKVTWALLPGYTQADLTDLDLRFGDKIIDNYLVDNNLVPAEGKAAIEVKPNEVIHRYIKLT